MLVTEEDESTYRIQYRNYLLPLIFLCLPPLMLIEHGSSLIDGSIETGELIGLLLGILLPLIGAYYYIELASFDFSKHDGVLTWHWRSLFKKRGGEVPFNRIVQVRREALESGDSGGLQYSHRLVVMLDDNSTIPLTRGYSRLYSKKLEQIVDHLQDFLGHPAGKR